MRLRYHAQRCVAASRSPGGPADTLICMVQIELPDGGITALSIPEGKILEHAKGNVIAEELFIQKEIKQVLASMLAGAVGDLQLTQG